MRTGFSNSVVRITRGVGVATGKYSDPHYGWVGKYGALFFRGFALLVLAQTSLAILLRLTATDDGSGLLGALYVWLIRTLGVDPTAMILTGVLMVSVVIVWLWKLAPQADLLEIECLALVPTSTLANVPELLQAGVSVARPAGATRIESVELVFVHEQTDTGISTHQEAVLGGTGVKLRVPIDDQVLCWVTPTPSSLRAMAQRARRTDPR